MKWVISLMNDVEWLNVLDHAIVLYMTQGTEFL
jgi:hypothetical protein